MPEVQPERSPNSISPIRSHGHATWEEHMCSHEVPRDRWQPERQPPSSFPEFDTANLRIDTVEDPRETKQAYPPPQSSLLSSALRNIGPPDHRAGSVGTRSSSLVRGKPGTGQLLSLAVIVDKPSHCQVPICAHAWQGSVWLERLLQWWLLLLNKINSK